jgi:hypothetical protein
VVLAVKNRIIPANGSKQHRKPAIMVFLVILLSVSLISFTAKADYAPGSSGTLNLSAPLDTGISWAKDEVPYSLVDLTSSNVTYFAGSTSSYGAGGTDVLLGKISQRLNVFPGLGSYYQDSITWRKTFGGPQDDLVRSIIQAGDGKLLLAGQTESYGAGGSDIYIIKTDLEGNQLWSKTIGGALDDGANAVTQAADGGYVIAGYTTSNTGALNAYLVKTDSQGQLLWNRTYAGSAFNSVSNTNDGGYILAASFANAFNLVKVDSTGQMQWSKNYALSGAGESTCAIQTSDGGYAITGYVSDASGANSTRLLKTDSSGNTQWDRTYPGLGAYSLIQTSGGGYALTGDRAFLLITDSSGNTLWNRNYDALSDDNLQFTRAYDLFEPSPNQFLLTGTQQSYGQILTGLDGFFTRVSLRNGDITSPSITILSPENKIYTTSNVPIICTTNKPTVWMAYRVDNGMNITVTGNTTITMADGKHNMTVYAADSDYNNGASNTVYLQNFAVDTVPINLNVTSVQNTTYTVKEVPLSFTVSKEISWAGYSLDGQANQTAQPNTKLADLSVGPHALTVYAQDVIGLVEASTVHFSVVDADNVPEMPNILFIFLALVSVAVISIVIKRKNGTRIVI